MFKYLASAAFAAVTVNAEDKKFLAANDLLTVQCQTILTDTGALFDITALQKADFYINSVSGAGEFYFNYCAYADVDNKLYGFEILDGTKYTYADSAIAPYPASSSTTTLLGSDGKTSGLQFNQKSAIDCLTNPTVKLSTTTKVQCDATNTVSGEAKIESVVESDDGCTMTVTLSHAAGCPYFDASDELAWIEANPWLIGIIYIIAGPIIALFGLQWFPYVTSSLVAIFVMGITVSLCLAFGWMANTTGTVVVLVVAFILGVVAGILIRRNIWIMVSLLGLVGGFFAGSLVYAIIFSFSGWSAVWGFWVISCVMAAIGCVISCYLGKPVVLLGTSMVGSYLFMRSWTLFFPGNYPSEAEILSGDFELENVGIFWTFIGVFTVSFIGSVIFQVKRSHLVHADLDDYKKGH